MGTHNQKELIACFNSCVMPLFVKVGDSLKFIGTGFTINNKGTMLTAAHVVEAIIKNAGMVVKNYILIKERNLFAYALNTEKSN